jgi:hypothetical protein
VPTSIPKKCIFAIPILVTRMLTGCYSTTHLPDIKQRCPRGGYQ